MSKKFPHLTLVAVYGSMRRRGYNHSIIEETEFVGKGIIRGLKLYFDGPCAVAKVDTRGHGQIVVEVYRVPEHVLKIMDMMEGANTFIGATSNRRLVAVEITNEAEESATRLDVNVYIYNFFVGSQAMPVYKGDYIRHMVISGQLEPEDDELYEGFNELGGEE